MPSEYKHVGFSVPARIVLRKRQQHGVAVPRGRLWQRRHAHDARLLGPMPGCLLLPAGIRAARAVPRRRLLRRAQCRANAVPRRRIRIVARPVVVLVLRRVLTRLLVPRGLDERDGRCVPAGHLRLEPGPADACLQRPLPTSFFLSGQLDEPHYAAVPRGHLRRDQRPRHAGVQRAVRGRLVLPPRLELGDGHSVPRGRVLRTRQRGADRLPTGCLWRLRQPRNGQLQRRLPTGHVLRRGLDSAVELSAGHVRCVRRPRDGGVLGPLSSGLLLRGRRRKPQAVPARSLLRRGHKHACRLPEHDLRQHDGFKDARLLRTVPGRRR